MKRRLISSGLAATISLGLFASGCDYDKPSVYLQSGSGGNSPIGSGGSTVDPGSGSGGSTVNPGTGGAGVDPGSGSGGSPGNPGSGGSIVAPGTGGATGNPGSGGSTVNGSGGAVVNPGTGGAGAIGTGGAAGQGVVANPYPKPRLIIQTDGEVDDRSTMVRFLMYASDYDIVGIIQVNSRYQTSGHSKELWVEKAIQLYGQTLPNLKIHNPNYPDASALMNVVRVGNENSADLFLAPSAMATKETAGSKFILEQMLNSDPRPLHFAVWGGANTLAYALYTLKSTMPTRVAEVASKLWIYCIWYQDNGGSWIQANIPEARIYEAFRWNTIWDYHSLTGPSPADVKTYMMTPWLNANVKTGRGVLGAYYPQTYVSEGDTPSWLPLINNGLYQYMDYTWGGWGGRPKYDKGNHMTDQGISSDDGDEFKPYWRWIPTAQNDFAGRMSWAVADTFAKANHNPKAQVVGGLQRDVTAGQMVTLDASPTTDPDGNPLTYKWWQYYDADSAVAKVTIANAAAKTASFVAPSEPGKQVHIILEVTDNGVPPLTNYQRIIFTIK